MGLHLILVLFISVPTPWP